jgi:hypothetical protein
MMMMMMMMMNRIVELYCIVFFEAWTEFLILFIGASGLKELK